MRWLILPASGFLMLLAMAACGGGSGSDEAQIRQLEQDSIDYSKEDSWSKFYDLSSQEFQERCPRDDFLDQVVTTKELFSEGEWKDMLEELKLVTVENIQIQEDTATAEVTSYSMGEEQTETDYYVKEDGKWRLAPAPGSEGCDTSGE